MNLGLFSNVGAECCALQCAFESQLRRGERLDDSVVAVRNVLKSRFPAHGREIYTLALACFSLPSTNLRKNPPRFLRAHLDTTINPKTANSLSRTVQQSRGQCRNGHIVLSHTSQTAIGNVRRTLITLRIAQTLALFLSWR